MTLESLSLKDLRDSISVLMQDPIVFDGTIKENLDPYENYKEDEISDITLKTGIDGLLGK